jgi:hypothetical protein
LQNIKYWHKYVCLETYLPRFYIEISCFKYL